MEIAGYEHFSMRDLYAPDTKRLKHQLSAIINLAKHRDEQLRFYTELIEPVSRLQKKLRAHFRFRHNVVLRTHTHSCYAESRIHCRAGRSR